MWRDVHVVHNTDTSTFLNNCSSMGVVLSGSMETVHWYKNWNLSSHTPNLCAYSEIFIPRKACWANIYFLDLSTGFNEPTPILALESPQYTKYVTGNSFSQVCQISGQNILHMLGLKLSKFWVGCQLAI